MHGGEAGAKGRNTLIRSSGEVVDLGGTAQVQVGIGDRIIIETPGGGGWGVSELVKQAGILVFEPDEAGDLDLASSIEEARASRDVPQ